MSDYVYPPHHDAVAVAAKLREEIASCVALIASKKAAQLRQAVDRASDDVHVRDQIAIDS